MPPSGGSIKTSMINKIIFKITLRFINRSNMPFGLVFKFGSAFALDPKNDLMLSLNLMNLRNFKKSYHIWLLAVFPFFISETVHKIAVST